MRAPRLLRGYAKTPTVGYDLSTPARGEAGSDGDPWVDSWISGGPDVNPALSGPAKFQVYDEMAKTDPSVKSMLHFLALPVRAAQWGLNPADDSPEARRIADFVTWNLGIENRDEGELDLSWDESLQQALKMLVFGAYFEELVWGDVREWRDADGNPRLVRPLARLAPRSPLHVQHVKREGGRIVEMQQNLPNTEPIPGDKLTYFVWERESNRWEGISLLRPAWGPWYFKRNLLVTAGIGWDRFATGIPAIWHPDTPDAAEKAKRIGRSVRTHERSYVHFPGKKGAEWDFGIEAGQMADPTPLLRYCSEQIAEAGMQQFTRQGLGQTGARATAEVQVDPYFLAVQALANYLRRERVRQVIRPLVQVNFGAEAAEKLLPKLTVSKIMSRSVSAIAQAIELLSAAGFTFTDREAVDDIRELLGLPELSDEMGLANAGIPREQLLQILQSLGLDSQTFAQIVNALPPDIGVARNTVPEGSGLQIPAVRAPTPRPALPKSGLMVS